MNKDQKTADAFADSWNNLPQGSVYTFEQFKEWLEPVNETDLKGKTVLELGCGNGSLLFHMTKWNPSKITGVDLGDSVLAAQKNMSLTNYKNWKIEKGDLTEYASEGYDFVYSIGVLHHLKDVKKGLDSVIRNTKSGGKFHCWVYAHEGNLIVRLIVEPLRIIFSNFPWWFTKYLVATPAVVPYYFYAKFLNAFKDTPILKKLPLYDYSLWIAQREFTFFRHVAFDQLVTPQTVYIKQSEIEKYLSSYPEIDSKSTYIKFRNGNSWKFGGSKK